MKFIILFFALVAVVMCEDCVDSGSDCASKTGEDCTNEEVLNSCAKSCHLCGECADSRPDCDVLKERGDCDKMDTRVCRKTCGAC